MDAEAASRFAVRTTGFLISALFTARAMAFASDVCFTESGQYLDCLPLPSNCAPGDNSDTCVAGVAAAAVAVDAQTASTGGQRSLLHMDYSYYLAQYLGFTADQAYWLAAYSEAMDLGQYVPRDKNGALIADPKTCEASPTAAGCDLITKSIDGLQRTNLITGGLFFHFDTPYSGTTAESVPGINGLTPASTQPDPELFLAHVRRWADPVSGSDLLCTHGITTSPAPDNYATGSSCYAQGQGEQISASMAVSEIVSSAPLYFTFTVPTGQQIIAQATSTTPQITSSNFDSYVGSYARYARLGIYLHSYQDRISHHRCLDQSDLSGPNTTSKIAFAANLAGDECVQGQHLIRHAWETGEPQSTLASEDQTLGAAVANSYDELLALATDMGVASSRATNSTNRQNFINAFMTALQTQDAQTRVMNMAATASSFGLQPLPGF